MNVSNSKATYITHREVKVDILITNYSRDAIYVTTLGSESAVFVLFCVIDYRLIRIANRQYHQGLFDVVAVAVAVAVAVVVLLQ